MELFIDGFDIKRFFIIYSAYIIVRLQTAAIWLVASGNTQIRLYFSVIFKRHFEKVKCVVFLFIRSVYCL